MNPCSPRGVANPSTPWHSVHFRFSVSRVTGIRSIESLRALAVVGKRATQKSAINNVKRNIFGKDVIWSGDGTWGLGCCRIKAGEASRRTHKAWLAIIGKAKSAFRKIRLICQDEGEINESSLPRVSLSGYHVHRSSLLTSTTIGWRYSCSLCSGTPKRPSAMARRLA